MENILSLLSEPIFLIFVGVVLIVLIVFIVIMSKVKKKKVSNSVDTSSSIPEYSDLNQPSVPFSEQNFNRQLMSQNQGVDSIVNMDTVDSSKPEMVPEVNLSDSVQPISVEPSVSEPSFVVPNPFNQQFVDTNVGVQSQSLETQSVVSNTVFTQSESFNQQLTNSDVEVVEDLGDEPIIDILDDDSNNGL